MNLTEVKKSLDRLFAREPNQGACRNIVFWYDEEGVFAEDIDDLALADARIVKLYDNNMFATKRIIEHTDPTSNLLVYSPQPRPSNRDNWLADTLLYSQTFSADETSNNMRMLGIEDGLRHVVDAYRAFFRNAERYRRFEGYHIGPAYTQASIDIAVHSALCRLPVPSLDLIVQALLVELARGGDALYGSIQKFGNPDALWRIIRATYGYDFPQDDFGTLADLMLCTHLSHGMDDALPEAWRPYAKGRPTCFVFVDNLMKNATLWEDYDGLSAFVADRIGLSAYLSRWTIDDIVACDTFEQFDAAIIQRILDNIDNDAGEYGHYRKIIHARKNMRVSPRHAMLYDALLHACEYLEWAVRCRDLQGYTTAELFDGYVQRFYRLDASYRHFLYAYDRLHGDETLRALYERVENSYTNWFLYELCRKWSALYDGSDPWQVPGIVPQQNFFAHYARRFVANDERIVVIISDGLRYESAVELNAMLNRTQKGYSEIDAMLGVVPSYTALGMAALLPHSSIEMTDAADVLVDGMSSRGTDARTKILQRYKDESFAIPFADVMGLGKQQMADRFAGAKLIYIYHDAIDGRGDNATTEHEVFDATNKAFEDIDALVRKLRNNISAINILITADHGYLYRRTRLEARDKTPKESAAQITGGRRFLLTDGDFEVQGMRSFRMNYLFDERSSRYAIVPRSTNCFAIQGGGNNYVHGGMSLQEVVVPVIRFKSDKNLRISMGAKKVSLRLTNQSHTITSVTTDLEFYQDELVDEKRLPLQVVMGFEDHEGHRVSNINTIVAESTSAAPKERTYHVRFVLNDAAIDRNRDVFLCIYDDDAQDRIEIERIPFGIEIG